MYIQKTTLFYQDINAKNIRTAIGVMGDVTLSASSQIFGGFTIPNVDKTLAPYYKMSIDLYEKEYREFIDSTNRQLLK
jgi:ribonucleoside-triphosphate reductase